MFWRPRLQGAPRVRDRGRVASSAECPNRAAHGQGNTCKQVRRPRTASPEANAEAVLPYNLPYKSRQLPSSGFFARLQQPCSDLLRRPAPSRKTLRGGLSVRSKGASWKI